MTVINTVVHNLSPYNTEVIIFKFFILTATFFNSCFGIIHNSVIPTVEYFESIENLPPQKLTKKQLKGIDKALKKKEEKIRLVTYNMLFDRYDANLPEENRWPNRLPRIVTLIQAMNPDIICTQELFPNQVQDIKQLLSSEYTFFSGDSDPDKESYGIFYRKRRFEVLSGQLEKPILRVEFKDLQTQKIVSIFNTHMTFANIEKREAQAYKMVQLVRPLAVDRAVIVTGDLNTFPARLDLNSLPFYDGSYIHRILSKALIYNAETRALIGHFGPISTFTNKGDSAMAFQGTGTPGVILDYIYTSKKITVLAHATESGTVDGHFPSDHMPVVIDFIVD